MRHTFRETWSGLRRNASMTVAVIVTMWVSLALFGASLMTMQQVEAMKGQWYDKIEVSVFLCTADNATDGEGGNCESAQGVTDAQRDAIRALLENHPDVQTVYYESKQDAFREFQTTYADNPIKNSLTADQMQDSFRVKLKDPQNYQDVVSAVEGLPGVQAVQDLHTVLDPFFRVLNVLKWGTMGIAAMLLLAGALQIGNSIRMSAYTRRREIAIMRLVGASNLYIMLPFLLEALFAGVVGILLAGASMAALQYFVVDRVKSQLSIQSLGWITGSSTALAIGGVAVVGVILSIIPTVLATRRYLRV
ncbi:cell division transport system permease protein [Propionibacterium cyclohexanicum]|uniref:Cell division protein FtsX n=1 Tax=Propionibacterium cyclohexanicum TaxID=64702 RepID=A0A1H9R6Z4_9ACTN|nr:permease-like cell division protein FtsX [Propionibacterium cyclohexanicum]SER68641.1 cell division transport system permease protein [Propionibacterium cyclohexanicum]